MRLPAASKKSLINLTPLIDMVFILLIFFMLASNFVEWKYIELGVSVVDELVVDHDQVSIVRIAENDRYYLNKIELPLDEVIAKIRDRVRINVDHSIVVQPTNNTRLQSMVNVLDRLQQFTGNNISIAKQGDKI